MLVKLWGNACTFTLLNVPIEKKNHSDKLGDLGGQAMSPHKERCPGNNSLKITREHCKVWAVARPC